ncbi:MAG: hypothetical protein AB8G22_13295 [Saprospiraceae bacterium]
MDYSNNLSRNAIIESKPISTNYTEEKGISFYEFGTTEGIIAGVGMSALLIFLEVIFASGELSIFAQFAVNTLLLGVIAFSLTKYKEYLTTGSVFR